MNAKQLQIFIRQSADAERWAKEIDKEIRPAFLQAMAEIREIVGELPDETLLREQQWRRLYLPRIEQALQPYNDALAQLVVGKMTAAGPEMEKEAMNLLRAAGALPAASDAVAFSATLPNFTRMALTSEVVQGTSLLRLFGYDPNGGPPQTTPPFTRSNLRIINQKVSAGIMNGDSTAQIANQIARVVERPGLRRLSLGQKGFCILSK